MIKRTISTIICSIILSIPTLLAQETNLHQYITETSSHHQCQANKTITPDSRLYGSIVADNSAIKAHKTKRNAAGVIDATGEYVMTYSTLITGAYDGGGSVKITRTSDTCITIEDFYCAGTKITGTYDATTGKITIPSQLAYTSDSYGAMDLAVITSDALPDRDADIEGQVNADGSISLTSWWAIFVRSGDYANKFTTANDGALLEVANGKLAYTSSSNTEVTYNVVVSQPYGNIVTVKNFANSGLSCDIELYSSTAGSIPSQTVLQNSYGDWKTIGNVAVVGTGITYDDAIAVTVDSQRKLSWTNWSMLATYDTSTYFYGLLTNTTLTTTTDLTLPTAISTGLQGSGTADSPYLIAGASDLRYLATTVNNATSSSDGRGVYYKITADIDMSSYRFEPIGLDNSHPFNGYIDGDGHTISGLNLIEPTGYTGLFGIASDYSTIANININNAKVVSTTTVAGIVVAYTEGVVKNCHVSNSYLSNTKAGAGCIASLAQTITGCTSIGNTVIAQGGYGAGIAGQIDIAISDCHVENTSIEAYGTSSGAPSGGVVAMLYGAAASDCSFNGSMNGSKSEYGLSMGGIAGYAVNGATLERCISAATIKGSGSEGMTGGLVGNLHGSITDCHSAGIVNGSLSKATGGITGYISTYKDVENTVYQSTIKSSFTTAYVQAYVLSYDKTNEARETLGYIAANTSPVLTNVYFDKQITNFSSTRCGAYTSELTSANGPAGFSSDSWTFSEGTYPALKSLASRGINDLAASTLVMNAGDNLASVKSDATLNAVGATKFMIRLNGKDVVKGKYASINDNNTLKLNAIGIDTLSIVNGNMSIQLPMNVAPLPYDGNGTADNPFLIRTKDDLIALGTMTNAAKQTFDYVYFKITNDIDLEKSEEFMGMCSPSTTSSLAFGGTIDGDGHTIHNMVINGIAWSVDPATTDDGMGTPLASGCKNYIGFVGRLAADGKIANLNIAADCEVTGYQYLGAVVGYNNGTVDNCRNYANVTGYSGWVSGIMGYGTATSVVTNCYNAGNITTGYMNVGGIAGYSLGKVENCANTGNIAAKSISTFRKPGASTIIHAGGIVGNVGGAIIKNVLNAGTVSAEYCQAGGITGLLGAKSTLAGVGDNSVYNAVNYGQVYSSKANQTGGIAGGSGTTGEITNNYWDSQVLPLMGLGSETPAGITESTTKQLTAGTTLDGFDSSIWQFDNGKYPVLKQFANEAKLIDARNAVITLPDNSNVYSLKEDITLPGGMTYRLASGTTFSLDNGTLKVPSTVTALVIDTLYVTNGSFTKPILIKAIPAVALNGDGTAENPYQISSPADWNTVAKHITEVNDEMVGDYLIVTNDIDFSDTTFSPIAADGLNHFQGTLDGNGKTIKGIMLAVTTTYGGCFGIIGKSGEVKNLTLEGTAESTALDFGGWVGKLYGTLSGCVNRLAVSGSRSRVGGMAARTFNGARMISCVNRGTVSGSAESIAGLVAYAEEGSYFENCGNEGDICNLGTGSRTAGLVSISMPSTYIGCYNSGTFKLSAPDETTTVAGLIGLANGAANCGEFNLTDCVNNTDITCVSSAAGMIVATSTVEGYSRLKLTRCVNNGNITTTSAIEAYTPTAGLLAYSAPGSTLSDCVNNGRITAQSNGFIGGIVGMSAASPTAENPVLITGCNNFGAISTNYGPAAGIAAMTGPYTTMENCHNEGNVIGGQLVGGLVGYFSGTHSAVNSSWNIASIECKLNSVGGLIGGANVNDSELTDCWNSGAVICSNTIGGVDSESGYAVGGIVGIMAGKIQRCFNVGTVAGYSKVGGIVGMPIINRTQIYDSYNAGKITAPADTCGGIIGVNPDYYRVWGAANVVSNTYFVNGTVTSNLSPVGTAIDLAELCKKDMGTNWLSTDDYTLPAPAVWTADDATAVYTASIIPAEGETCENITKPFNVGTPGAVTWSADNSAVSIDGRNVTFMSAFKGDVTMTATAGKYAKTQTVSIDNTSALRTVSSDADVKGVIWHNLQGIEVAAPTSHDGTVYLKTTIYSDGTVTTAKVLN